MCDLAHVTAEKPGSCGKKDVAAADYSNVNTTIDIDLEE